MSQVPPTPERPTRPIVACSRFVVANGLEHDVAEAFLNRPHLVDSAEGFLRMEVLRPQHNPAEFWLLTWWTDQDCYARWHRSHRYRDAHRHMPPGLKLVSGATTITLLNSVAS